MLEGITLADYEKAEVELRAKEGQAGFFVHSVIYVLVNILLITMNLVFIPTVLWFFYPLIGWGIGLAMHYLFAIQFVRRETVDWQAKVEYRARELRAQQNTAL